MRNELDLNALDWNSHIHGQITMANIIKRNLEHLVIDIQEAIKDLEADQINGDTNE
jgi:hypothetical protein